MLRLFNLNNGGEDLWKEAEKLRQRLQDHYLFRKVKLSIRKMPKSAKAGYWAYTHISATLANGVEIERRATIFLNMRDIWDKGKLLDVFVHEGSHIIGEGYEQEIRRLLEKFQEK